MSFDHIAHDRTVLVALHVALLLWCLIAIGQVLWTKRRASTATGTRAVGTATRGDRSMNFLYVGYGLATVVYTLSIQVADAFLGYKAMFIVLDYMGLTYLFFFNSWFRNKLFGIQDRIQKD